MRISRAKGETIEFSHVESIEAELLKQIAAVTHEETDPNVNSRLYPDPGNDLEGNLVEDWAELIRPELESLFFSSRQVVEKDVAQMKQRRGIGSLSIPLAHADAWLNALSQARLVLATKYEFTEDELLRYEPPIVFSRRDLVLVQINFYAAIQERLIDALKDRWR